MLEVSLLLLVMFLIFMVLDYLTGMVQFIFNVIVCLGFKKMFSI